MIIHPTDRGMVTFDDDEFADQLESETGRRPEWRAHTFSDLEGDLRASIRRIKGDPFVPRTVSVRGFVYEAESGRLREVS